MIKSAWTWGGVADTVTDYLPFVGAAKDIGRGVGSMANGHWGRGLGEMAMGAGFGALDFATAGLGGTALRAVGKLGMRGALEAGAHAAGEAGLKGIAAGGGRAFARAAPSDFAGGVVAEGANLGLNGGSPAAAEQGHDFAGGNGTGGGYRGPQDFRPGLVMPGRTSPWADAARTLSQPFSQPWQPPVPTLNQSPGGYRGPQDFRPGLVMPGRTSPWENAYRSFSQPWQPGQRIVSGLGLGGGFGMPQAPSAQRDMMM